MIFNLNSFFNVEGKQTFFKQDNVLNLLKDLKDFFSTLELGKIEGTVSTEAVLINPEQISIGKGSVVEAGAYIKGPCFIGKNTQIRHGAYMRGYVWVGHGCVVGHATEVKHSIFFDGAKAGHFAYVGDSILGNRVNLGAGVKCANLKFNEEEVIIHYQGNNYKTGLKKLGAIIGDDTQIGCNAVSNPGTLLEKNVWVYPLTHVEGVIPFKSIVKNQTKTLIKQRR